MRALLVVAVLSGLTLLVLFGYHRSSAGQPHVRTVAFRTAKVEQGEVVQSVDAIGVVKPLVLVQVGSQISGIVEKLYKDYNSRVVAGETIALLDSRKLVEQCRLDEIALVQAEADVAPIELQLREAERIFARRTRLFERMLATEEERDAASSAVETLRARLVVAKAGAARARAQLKSDQLSAAYATIVSPIDGVVVSRNVDVGQTVAASLAAPVIFTIANDLTKMRVEVVVPESDINQIHEGQRTRFHVDAAPESIFQGVVSQRRLAATVNQNVVNYTVVIEAANPDGILLPDMTANVTFEIARSPADSLCVPVTAVRFEPSNEIVEGPLPAVAGDESLVYVTTSPGHVHGLAVKRGVSDGLRVAVTPLEKGALRPGDEVVLGILPEEEEATVNPFAK